MALKNHAMEPGRETYLVSYYNKMSRSVEREPFDGEDEAREFANDAVIGNLDDVECNCAHISKVIYINSLDKGISVSERF